MIKNRLVTMDVIPVSYYTYPKPWNEYTSFRTIITGLHLYNHTIHTGSIDSHMFGLGNSRHTSRHGKMAAEILLIAQRVLYHFYSNS